MTPRTRALLPELAAGRALSEHLPPGRTGRARRRRAALADEASAKIAGGTCEAPSSPQHCVNGHGGCPRGGLMDLELRRWTNTVGAAADTARRAARPCPRQGARRPVRGCHRDRAGRGAARPPPRTATPAPCRRRPSSCPNRVAQHCCGAGHAHHRDIHSVGSEAPTMFKRRQHRSSVGHL